MGNPNFAAGVTFELLESSRKWARYKITDDERGSLGFFRLNSESRYIDEHDEEGEVMLGDYFVGAKNAREFLDRHELLNWLFDVLATFFDEETMPKYRYVST